MAKEVKISGVVTRVNDYNGTRFADVKVDGTQCIVAASATTKEFKQLLKVGAKVSGLLDQYEGKAQIKLALNRCSSMSEVIKALKA